MGRVWVCVSAAGYAAALCAALCCTQLHSAAAAIQPFSLADVSLGDATLASRHAALNLEYLFRLSPDRLLWTFRANAGLEAPGDPYQGTWEDQLCEVRGQFMGHYLTALSLTWQATGNVSARDRIHYLVEQLAGVQAALGGGYLSAFPAEHFDRLQGLQPVWAPYYVIHKIMAGLLDAHDMAGDTRALTMVLDMAAYFLRRIDLTLQVNGTEHWQEMLQTEFGGMNDVMYRLHATTGDPEHLRMARLFDKQVFWVPLVHRDDPLAGLHANTHLAQVVGFASRYDVTRDPDARAAVEQFFHALTAHHSYATGGSNDHEMWGPPDSLADAIFTQHDATETQETCTTYNVMKLARSLFRWSGDVAFADFYERALLNGIIGVSRVPSTDIHIEASAPSAVAEQSLTTSEPQAALHATATDAGTAHSSGAALSATAARHFRAVADRSEGVMHGLGARHPDEKLAAAQEPGLKALPSPQGDAVGDGAAGAAAGAASHAEHDHAAHAGHGHAHAHSWKLDTAFVLQAVSGLHSSSRQAAAERSARDGRSSGGLARQLLKGAHVERQAAIITSTPDHLQPADKVHAHTSQSSLARARHQAGSAAGSERTASSPEDGLPQAPAGLSVPVHDRWRLPFLPAEQAGLGFGAPPPGASNAPGPGVYLYLLPLGAGNSKADSFHHWGFPENSFWCCYGTAVESFSKLHDSIYFVEEGDDNAASPRAAAAASAQALAAATASMTVATATGSATAPTAGAAGSPDYGVSGELADGEAEGEVDDWLLAADSPPPAERGSALRHSPAAKGEPQTPAPLSSTKQAPVLYVNQLVSSTLRWRRQQVVITQESTLFAPGPSGAADIHITAAPRPGLRFTLALRIPSWVAASGRLLVQVNSVEWHTCPGWPSPGSYCHIDRLWLQGDVLRVSLPLAWRLEALAEARPQFSGLQALMSGPFVMAGQTHAGRHLALPHGSLDKAIYLPDEAEGLLSLQAAWNQSVYVRHDLNLLHVSEIQDNGDAADATFRVIQGCFCHAHLPKHLDAAQLLRGSGNGSAAPLAWSSTRGPSCSRQEAVASSTATAEGDAALGADAVVTLEAMNAPGAYVSFDPDLTLGLDRPDGSLDFCDSASFLLRPGLTGQPGSRSLEAASKPGWFLSGYMPPSGAVLPPCRDMWSLPRCTAAVSGGLCVSQPEVGERHCRMSCGRCTHAAAARHSAALRLQRPGGADEPDFAAQAAASTFWLADPLTPQYTDGAYVVAGLSRSYLVVPLGNLVDERYTVYFDLVPPGPHASASTSTVA